MGRGRLRSSAAPRSPLVEKRPYIYMGGYDPKVIKNREKLHFFFAYPSFCFLHLAKQRDFIVKSTLLSCELVVTSSPLPLNFLRFSPHFFRKISVVFAQTMDFLKISGLRGKISGLRIKTSGLRGKTPASLSLKISSALSLKPPWSAHKNPLHMRCRGD